MRLRGHSFFAAENGKGVNLRLALFARLLNHNPVEYLRKFRYIRTVRSIGHIDDDDSYARTCLLDNTEVHFLFVHKLLFEHLAPMYNLFNHKS